MATIEERVETLEKVVAKLIESITHLTEEMRKDREESRRFREEMRKDREESRRFREEMYKDREAMREEMRKDREESRRFREEMQRTVAELRKTVVDMRRQWGEVVNRMGTLVEDIVAPNLPRIAKQYFGCTDIEFFAVRVRRRHSVDKSKSREFDVIVVCDNNTVLLNETKTTPRVQYIDAFADFIQRGEFFEYFPEYRGKKLVPIFSSLYMGEDIVNYLTKKRIYAMAMGGETMDLLNANQIK